MLCVCCDSREMSLRNLMNYVGTISALKTLREVRWLLPLPYMYSSVCPDSCFAIASTQKEPHRPDPRIALQQQYVDLSSFNVFFSRLCLIGCCPFVHRLLEIYKSNDPDAVMVKASHRVTLLLGQKAISSNL